MLKEMPKNGDTVRIKGKIYTIIATQRVEGLSDPPTLKFLGFELRELTFEKVDKEIEEWECIQASK